jgi:hypothetical protein
MRISKEANEVVKIEKSENGGLKRGESGRVKTRKGK